MGALYWKDTTGAADVCKAVTDCAGTNGHATPVTRVQVDAATATADRTCTPCSNGFWAAAGDNTNCVAVAMKCGDQVAVGGAAPVMREITSVATITADIGCGACASGSFPSSATGACTACTLVAGSIAGTPLTCTSASDSRVTGHKCLACAAKTVGAAGAHDTCTEACAAGSYRANTGLCTACSTVNDAATGATYTCASSTTTRFATGGCTALTHYKVAGLTADSCKLITACSSNQATGACFPRVQVDAPTATADRTCTSCAAGTFAANGQTNCVACSINNADATANAVTYTCTSNADVRFATGGCAATHYKVAGLTADSCKLITACEVSAGVPSTQLTGACFARVQVDAPTATADRTCTVCAAGTFAPNGQTNCVAHTVCGTQVGGASRLVGASGILAGSCALCTAGTFAAGDGDCAACTPVANSEGLTCASATTSRVTKCAATYGWTSGGAGHDTCVAACPCGQWAKPWVTGQPLRCTAHGVCGDQLAGAVMRATTTAGTATADKVCADCAADTYAAGYWADCAAITACGAQLTCGARVEVDAATTTADRTCTACADGTYEGAGRNCVECTAISGASAVTCTSNADSIATTCVAQCPKKTTPTAAAGTCSSTCAAGYWDNSDTCDACTPVTNAGAVTCTSATTSVTGGACDAGYFLTAVAGTADICTMDTVCDASRPQVTAATDTADTKCTDCPTGESSEVNGGVCAKTTTAAPAATTAAPGSATTAAPAATTAAPAGGVAAGNTATIGFASVVLAVFAAVGL